MIITKKEILSKKTKKEINKWQQSNKESKRGFIRKI
jgi:hypothetical protein